MTDSAHPAIASQLLPAENGSADHAVVFLHGLFGRGKNLLRLAAGLQPEATSLLIDLPNHGGSAWTDTFDYAEMADLVAAQVRECFPGGRQVDVVGHSMGGKVAMVLALRHPELVRRLVVMDISPVASGDTRGNFPHLLDSLAAVDLTSIERRADAGAALRTSIPDDGVRGFLLQNLRRDAAGFSWEPNLELLRSSLATVMGFPEVAGRTFGGPVLWIKGERSDYITDADGPAMRALFPRTVRITVRDAGHWVHAEQPEAVITALRRFLLAGGSED